MNRFYRTAAAILALAAIAVDADAAPKVKWLEKDYNFGLIYETEGKAPGRVRFVNTGKEPVVITGARAACGCTGVEYPQEPIAPGDTATVAFTYNPAGRPGPFEKSIRIYLGDDVTERVMIRGTVLGTRESLEPIYPVEVGPLRLSSEVLPLLEMKYGETRNVFINVYNQTTDTVVPQVTGAPKALDVRISTPSVAPGELATISFYFNSRLQPEVGPVEIPLELVADTRRPGSASLPLTFRADVKPDFSSLDTDDVEKAPSCYISPSVVDLGVLAGDRKGDGKHEFSFSILNEGKSRLDVLRIVAPGKEIQVKGYPTRLKPGKSGQARGILDTSGLAKGPFRLELQVITNDPLHPTRTVRVVGIRE